MNNNWARRNNHFWSRINLPLNIDLSHRCPLECLQCGRQRHWKNKGLSVPGKDMTLEDFEKIIKYFKVLAFCGQYSDPIHHPKFLQILQICNDKKLYVEVHVASSAKSKEFYIDAFKTYPNARWIFGIDGLPEQSCTYRINQDGLKLFQIMIESKKYLARKPLWQYIIFNYNEDKIDQALEMAKQNGLDFVIINSARWSGEDDPLRPTKIF